MDADMSSCVRTRKRVPWLALLCAILLSPAHAATLDPEARYQSLLAAAKAADQPVDWQALRFAYADRPSFNVFRDGLENIRKQMFAAVSSKDYAGALNLAQRIIGQDYIDADAHLIIFLCYVKMGQPEKGVRDREIGLGLIRSINTGDGRTPATALSVITVPEEYTFLRASGLRPVSQSLVKEGGHSYDLLSVIDQTGKPRPVYFLIDRILAAEAAALKPNN